MCFKSRRAYSCYYTTYLTHCPQCLYAESAKIQSKIIFCSFSLLNNNLLTLQAKWLFQDLIQSFSQNLYNIQGTLIHSPNKILNDNTNNPTITNQAFHTEFRDIMFQSNLLSFPLHLVKPFHFAHVTYNSHLNLGAGLVWPASRDPAVSALHCTVPQSKTFLEN